MRKIEKNYTTISLNLSKTKDAIKEVSELNKKYTFEGYNTKEVKTELTKIYNKKCAFCETDPTIGSYLEVEHYRPKGKIFEDNIHKGYYWLAYEWSNLLFACRKCNGAKANHFPILGTRQMYHPTTNNEINYTDFNLNAKILIDEKPLILNPEEADFKPEEHFKINSKGKLISISERGKKTIEICQLNREELLLKRRLIIDELLYDIAYGIENEKSNLNIYLKFLLNKVQRNINENNEYTFLYKTILYNFKELFISRFLNNVKELTEIYENLIFNFDK